MPMALGWKAKSLLRIMVAFHHAVRHETHSLANLTRFCHSIYGIMTDMGTELGAAECRETSKEQWVPEELLQGERLVDE